MDVDILSNLVITKVYFAATMYNEKNSGFKRIDRPRWAMVYKYEGETLYDVDGKQYLSDREHPVILPKGCSYEWKCIRSGHCVMVEFESELTCPYIFGFQVTQSEKLLRLFKKMEYERNLKAPMIEQESMRDAYSILLFLTKSEPKKYLPTEKQRKIAPTLDYIARCYNTKIKNDELAAMAGLSTVYFRKLFTEIMGQSPADYVQSVRIGKAKEMLQSDYGSITDIAFSLGYLNIYDFSRVFKKYVGVSPKQYQEQLRH
ncbi:MAG: AraC family transcriptional regulator [Clostridia bacterium]|nr:AraC family transcriptional regulator [Clostridia bacterium]MDY6184126.1 AraC family transcriptional regulator [Eubacteriales bacterium]